MLTTGHKKRKKKKRQDLVFRFDCLQHGSGLPKISVGTMIEKKKKRYLGNENYKGLYWRDPTMNNSLKKATFKKFWLLIYFIMAQ